MTFLLAVIGLAGVPEDLATWARWLALLDEPHTRSVLLFLALAIFVAIQWWEWRLLQARVKALEGAHSPANDTQNEPATEDDGPLMFEVLIRKLHLPEAIVAQKKMAAALSYPHFAAISVENNGRRNLGSLIARVEIEGDEQPANGVWLSESPTSFAPLSDDGIGLVVGAKRLLVLAVTFRPRVTRGPDTSWFLVSSRLDAHHYFDLGCLMERGSNLGRQPRFRIRFRAEGADQSISGCLSSTPDGEPAIKVEPLPC